MRKSSVVLGALAGLASVVLAGAGAREAAACGGCFHPPDPPVEQVSVITDHRMILSISPQQTTLYDQIRYTGSPQSFAWVLPISGVATVGLSSDLLFGTLDQLTSTQVEAPPMNCPPPPTCNRNFGPTAAGGAAADSGAAEDRGVTVTKHEVVGPYETVQLHSTDPNALNAWLTANNFSVPDSVKPIVAAYVNDHFDFLALKLVPGANVQSMRPVRVTTAGASPVLPLRMVAAGTGATVGVTLWVVGDGRYEPQNFASFRVPDDELVWDWASSTSNFKALRTARAAALGGKGWEIESSLDLSEQTVRNYILYGGYNPRFGGPGGGGVPAGNDYTSVPATDAGAGATPEQVRDDDLKALFTGIGAQNGNARVTRIRADLAHEALVTDLTLAAAADQSPLPNLRKVTKENGEPLCAVFNGNCQQVGQVPRSEAKHATKESFACSTSGSPSMMTELTLGVSAGLLGVFVVGARRRRARK